MKKLFYLVFLLPFGAFTQTTKMGGGTTPSRGIKWNKGLTWDAIIKKAIQEKKYIFLDCFATWCGPCKVMDRSVFTSDSVAEFFNKNFISVKVQIDQTNKDNEEVKKWYTDAALISKLYHIEGFPTFVFLSPQGNVVHIESGYKTVKEFLSVGTMALQPGKTYNDPYTEYEQLIAAYKKGEKRFEKYPLMIQTARKLKETDLVKQLSKEYTDYVVGLSSEERYTKENIELWVKNYDLNLDGVRFKFFYEDGNIIDKAMNEKGYADTIVEKSIQRHIVDSFFLTQAAGEKVVDKGEMQIRRRDGKISPELVEADWKKLEEMIRQRLSKADAKRNVLEAKIRWYKKHENYSSYVRCMLDKFRSYPLNPNDYFTLIRINDLLWNTFRYVTDKKLIKEVSQWADKIVKQIDTDNPEPWAIKAPFLDSYANLLYKGGRKSEAIQWQEQAIKLSPDNISYQETLQRILSGERTYLNQGAIWE